MSDSANLFRFDLDAIVGVSELRNEATVAESLHAHARLCVQRRGEPVGVLVAPEAWRELAAYVENLERVIDILDERFEEVAVRAIITQRANDEAMPRRLTSDDLSAIERAVEERLNTAR